VAADRLGLALGPGAAVHLAPSIGGFIGGDHVAALLATEPNWRQPGTTLLMDIGTNTEISLHPRGRRILSASCPSGPALEGGHIGSGMRAAEGCHRARRGRRRRAAQLQVIGGGAPVGLCGSGVLDALAAFVGAGWIDARGRIVAGRHGRIGEVDGLRAITLADEVEERPRQVPAVRFSQHDVRAVQLAKSAIRTGVRLLCAEAGLDETAIDRFVIAGAFRRLHRVSTARAPSACCRRCRRSASCRSAMPPGWACSRCSRRCGAALAPLSIARQAPLCRTQRPQRLPEDLSPTHRIRTMSTDPFRIRIIGERINPGFKSTKALFDNQDIAGIQALAVKQAQAGASWLNVNVGARALTDTPWMATVIARDPGCGERAAVVRLPEQEGAGRVPGRL
jgi:hypothetical protein